MSTAKFSLKNFLIANPSFDLTHTNLLNPHVINNLNWPADHTEKNLEQLRSLQRLNRLTNDADDAENLYEQGMSSAYQIAALDKLQFIEHYGNYLNEGKEAAEAIYNNAVSTTNQVALTSVAITQQTAPYYQATRFNNLSQATNQTYGTLPSYQELFGSLDFCNCPDCRTIFSPAAYFVDLMRLQDMYISFRNDDGGDRIGNDLQQRRPDLCNILLNCDNTNTQIPKINIVNTVLANASSIATEKNLISLVYPFDLPFDWPLTRIQQYLLQQGTSLSNLWLRLSATPTAVNSNTLALATLNISTAQWAVMSTDNSGSAAAICKTYGLSPTRDWEDLAKIDVFLAQTNLDNNQLNTLLRGDLSTTEPQYQTQLQAFFINTGTKQPPIEFDSNGNLSNISLVGLDHIQRLIRLSNSLGWSFSDVDWALQTIAAVNKPKASVDLNATILVYLSWMQEWQQQLGSNFSVNWACALLGNLKSFGQINGPNFFASIFNAPNVPIPDQWFNSNDPTTANITWNVPTPNIISTLDKSGQQIQNALAAALSISVNDLLTAAQLFIDTQQANNQALKLTLSNLAVLYRLSQLHVLTGWSLQETLVAINLLPLTNSKEVLTGSDGGALLTLLNQLTSLSQYLQSAQLSVYHLEYWLTGDSHDLTIKNAILHDDAIQNFTNTFQLAITPTLLTKLVLAESLATTLQDLPPDPKVTDSYLNIVWTYLTSGNGFIDTTGIVVMDPQANNVLQTITDALIQELNKTAEQVSDLASLLQSTLIHYQDLQQYTTVNQLASLCHINSEMMLPLVNWVTPTLPTHNITYLPIAQVLQNIIPATSKPADGLRLLQRLTKWVIASKLSAAELKSVQQNNTSPCYGINYTQCPGITWLNLTVIQNIYQFKQLIYRLQDTQNKLLAYLDWAMDPNNQNQTPTVIASQLALLVGEQYQSSLAFLITQLWPTPTSPSSTSIVPPWSIVSNLGLLLNYFDMTSVTHLNVNVLWQIVQLTTTNDYDSWQCTADALWAGLQKAYQDKPAVLQTIQGNLSEQKRDVLLNLTMYTLNQKLPTPIDTPRGLYEYLLIDVEVSNAVTSSFISEGISAVQLYIYRCLNSLVPTLMAASELAKLWSWMSSYRTWQANRNVFIFPENYLEPQLRHNKTPLFLTLENSLNQTSFGDASAVEAVFRQYLNGLEEVSHLIILGAAVYDDVLADTAIYSSNTSKTKTLCLIAQTPHAPYRYYYRMVLLLQNRNNLDQFIPVEWGAWQSMDLQLKPQGAITPIFALGRWFIFWVEWQQTGSSGTQPPTPMYTANICYSYLDTNNHWSAPQTMQSGLQTTADQVYPHYVYSLNLLLVPYGSTLYLFNASYFNSVSLLKTYVTRTLPSLPSGINTLVENYLYYDTFDATVSPTATSVSCWIKLTALPAANMPGPCIVASSAYSVAVDSDGFLSLFNGNTKTVQGKTNLELSTWYHLVFTALSPSNSGVTITTQQNTGAMPCILSFNNQQYIGWVDPTTQQVTIAILLEGNSTSTQKITHIFSSNVKADPASGVSMVNFNNQIYMTFTQQGLGYWGSITFDENGLPTSVQTIKQIQGGPPNQSPIGSTSVVNHQDALYIMWFSFAAQAGFIAKVNADFTVASAYLPLGGVDPSLHQITGSLISYQGNLYASWRGVTGQITAGKITLDANENPEIIHPQNCMLDGVIAYMPTLCVHGGLLYTLASYTIDAAETRTYFAMYQCGLDVNGEISGFSVCPTKIPAAAIHGSLMSIEDSNGQYAYSWKGDNGKIILAYYVPAKQTCWINGQVALATEINAEMGIYKIGANGSYYLNGEVQELCCFPQMLTQSDAEHLYQNSVNHITQSYTLQQDVSQVFSQYNVAYDLFITTQPNWHILQMPVGENILLLPTNILSKLLVDCYRLNTTSISQLKTQLFSAGIAGLLNMATQQSHELPFALLNPNTNLINIQPTDIIDFFEGAYSNYYWELFFYAPHLIANMCSTQQQFAQAKVWYEYIFNPTISVPTGTQVIADMYWNFTGLQSANNPELYIELTESWAEEVQGDVKNPLQLYAYHDDPFDPHAIAQLRPIAYQKNIVMGYIDNLIQWGDNLFREYTNESIVEATMFYVTAYDLLGKKPRDIGACPLPDVKNITQILAAFNDAPLKDISEFLIIILENAQPRNTTLLNGVTPANFIPNAYFGLPDNDQFMAYWETIIQRLNNIRHALTIDGVSQQLRLMQPALGALQVVKALSQGQSVAQLINGLQVDLPYYRFNVIIEKAKQIAQIIIQFGQSLLGAFEKKDAEQLSLISNLQQQQILALTQQIQQEQLTAAQETLNALNFSLQSAQARFDYYSMLLGDDLSAAEISQLTLDGAAVYLQAAAQVIKSASIVGYLLPNIFGLADGGMNYGGAIQSAAGVMEGSAFANSMASGLAGTIAGYQRRNQDWVFQQQQAQSEVDQIQSQITAAQAQIDMVNQSFLVLSTQMQQQQHLSEFLKTKFSNEQLYQWLIGKLSTLYFQAYQLAYGLALIAEQAWQFERGKNTVFIQGAYWDNLYQGLSAGEGLLLDLNRMDAAYIKQNKRYLEITKTISLAQFKPDALQLLKTTGSCQFSIGEADFDWDYPGHYRRQIKSISVSLPSLLGPYQNLHAILTQTNNQVLLEPNINDVKYLIKPTGTPSVNIRSDMRANQQIALSQGVNDSGLFVLNFDDERYLPFEGTGAIANWQLDLPLATNSIDFNTITDVIITLHYTAAAGDKNFCSDVQNQLGNYNGYVILPLAQKFSTAWQAFIEQQQTMNLTMSNTLLRRHLKDYQLNTLKWQLILTPAGNQIIDPTKLPSLTLTVPGISNTLPVKFVQQTDGSIIANCIFPASTSITAAPQTWMLNIDPGGDPSDLLKVANCQNLLLQINYQGGVIWGGA